MTQSPPIPRSRRNLSDLDSLIDASIGKSGSYGSAGPAAEKVDSHTDAVDRTRGNTLSPISSELTDTGSLDPLNDGGVLKKPRSERFRINIDASVIMATKVLALQQNTSPSQIVERALRDYLDLLAN